MRTLPPSQTSSVPDETQVYTPREDSFLLLEEAQKEILEDDSVLEVGTGSGYVASGISGMARLVATDINPHAILMTRRKGVQVIRTDLTSGLRRAFSLVLFNPPYLPTLPTERLDDWLEYALDGGPDGCEVVRRFLKMVPGVLLPGGRVLILISSLQGFSYCESLFSDTGYRWSVTDALKLEDGEDLKVYRLLHIGIPVHDLID